MDIVQTQGQSSPPATPGIEPRLRTLRGARRLSPRERPPRVLASPAHTQRKADTVDMVARVLGSFSVALGVAELLAPRALDRAIGAGVHSSITRLCGLRELTAGVGLLTRSNPEPWLWSRVAGAALDLALLASAMVDTDDDERMRLIGSTGEPSHRAAGGDHHVVAAVAPCPRRSCSSPDRLVRTFECAPGLLLA